MTKQIMNSSWTDGGILLRQYVRHRQSMRVCSYLLLLLLRSIWEGQLVAPQGRPGRVARGCSGTACRREGAADFSAVGMAVDDPVAVDRPRVLAVRAVDFPVTDAPTSFPDRENRSSNSVGAAFRTLCRGN